MKMNRKGLILLLVSMQNCRMDYKQFVSFEKDRKGGLY